MIQSKDNCINILTQYKNANAKKYGIESIGLFGSVARGEQRADSDIDVIIELKNSDYFVYCTVLSDLEKLFSHKVDLVQKHRFMRPLFMKNIERDAIMV